MTGRFVPRPGHVIVTRPPPHHRPHAIIDGSGV